MAGGKPSGYGAAGEMVPMSGVRIAGGLRTGGFLAAF